ncbi:MAG: methylated-DNA--[protein]-cysteine S-methyltransferase [Balneolaceae bacterium]|nr:methylated-DNA--[protein]-cysteine S-methyltransferase [Balneolaceae bacterium]MCH8550147.1 methylated-DNA--[protein]-cysteine S-methyltransferase [Balneolaceae bacterium]
MEQSEIYQKMARAIRYLDEFTSEQPNLEELAEVVNMSPFHFQRTFTRWAGVSPKTFLQMTTANRAGEFLRKNRTLNEAAEAAGLSGTGRLHDLFVKVEAMTPGEIKKGAEGLTIRYSINDSRFGAFVAASTQRGLCDLHFTSDIERVASELKSRYPSAEIQEGGTPFHKRAASIINKNSETGEPLSLHLKGTPFQLQIWRALLRIPEGRVISYSGLAESAGRPSAVRAAGSATGKNPVAWLIPCHRVIRSTGAIGEYRWGSERKRIILGAELSKNQLEER